MSIHILKQLSFFILGDSQNEKSIKRPNLSMSPLQKKMSNKLSLKSSHKSLRSLFHGLINIFDNLLEGFPAIFRQRNSFFGWQPFSILLKVLSDIDHGHTLESAD